MKISVSLREPVNTKTRQRASCSLQVPGKKIGQFLKAIFPVETVPLSKQKKRKEMHCCSLPFLSYGVCVTSKGEFLLGVCAVLHRQNDNERRNQSSPFSRLAASLSCLLFLTIERNNPPPPVLAANHPFLPQTFLNSR